MNLSETLDCSVVAENKFNGMEFCIESMRFDKLSKQKLQSIFSTGKMDVKSSVLRISCLLIDPVNYMEAKPYKHYSGVFFPDASSRFYIKDFDIYFRQKNVVEYEDLIEISDASMIIYEM